MRRETDKLQDGSLLITVLYLCNKPSSSNVYHMLGWDLDWAFAFISVDYRLTIHHVWSIIIDNQLFWTIKLMIDYKMWVEELTIKLIINWKSYKSNIIMYYVHLWLSLFINNIYKLSFHQLDFIVIHLKLYVSHKPNIMVKIIINHQLVWQTNHWWCQPNQVPWLMIFLP